MPFNRYINFDGLNEADVRGEVVDPLLRELGYQAGTENNIVRERSLRYERTFLGRKKKTDPPLVGRPDYILEVGTAGRWLIEAKPPHESLEVEAFEQAQSYALHPNVAAYLFAVTNGRHFKIYQSISQSHDDTILEFSYEDGEKYWPHLHTILCPAGFRRAVPQIKFDPRLPVAKGFGPRIRLGGGRARGLDARISLPVGEDALRPLRDMQTPIRRGACERMDDGQLAIIVEFGSNAGPLEDILERKGLKQIPMVTKDLYLSTDPEAPTLFGGMFEMKIATGEPMYDMSTWKMVAAPFPMDTFSIVDAQGYLDGERILGTFVMRMYLNIPGLMNVEAEQIGEFEVEIVEGG